MTHSHTLGDLAAPLSLGVSGVALIAFVLAFADASVAYFDPRPALRTAAESGALRPVWQVAVHAGHDFNRVSRSSHEAFRDAAALFILLTTRPKGALS